MQAKRSATLKETSLRSRRRHECELSKDDPEPQLPHAPPYSSLLTKLWYKYRYLITVSNSHSDYAVYFRSNNSFLREKIRHLCTPRYTLIIHPLSQFQYIRQYFLCIHWTMMFFIFPFYCSYGMHFTLYQLQDSNMRYVFRVFNTVEVVNIILNFFTGYTVTKTKEIILEPKQIVKKYLKSLFIFDFIPCASLILFFYSPHAPDHRRYLMFIIRVVHIMRLGTTLRYFQQIWRFFDLSESFTLFLNTCVLLLVFLHWLTCTFGAVPRLYKYIFNYDRHSFSTFQEEYLAMHSSLLENYCRVYVVVMLHFFGADVLRMSHETIELLVLSLALLLGYVFLIIMLALVLMTFGTVSVSERRFDELYEQMQEYMAKRQMPKPLRKRIDDYITFKYDGCYFKDEHIYATMTEHLRYEVLLYSCKTLIDRVQIFKGMSRSAIGTILANLEEDIYLANDPIMDYQIPTDKLYLILHGTCTVVSFMQRHRRKSATKHSLTVGDEVGREVLHYEDGDHIHDCYKLCQESGGFVKLGVEAVETVQIFTITKKKLMYCCGLYPEIYSKLEQAMKYKLKFYAIYLPMMEHYEEDSEKLKTNDILTRLRKKEVLDWRRIRKQQV